MLINHNWAVTAWVWINTKCILKNWWAKLPSQTQNDSSHGQSSGNANPLMVNYGHNTDHGSYLEMPTTNRSKGLAARDLVGLSDHSVTIRIYGHAQRLQRFTKHAEQWPRDRIYNQYQNTWLVTILKLNPAESIPNKQLINNQNPFPLSTRINHQPTFSHVEIGDSHLALCVVGIITM